MKKWLAVLLVSLLVASMLPASVAVGEAVPVALRFMWWGGDERHEATLKVIEQFMAKNPGVTIEAEYGSMDGYYQKLMTQLAAGTEADIIQVVPEWFMPLATDGTVFYNLDEGVDIAGFDQSYLEANCTVNGHVQALPTGMTGQIMVVNKDFMKKFGIPEDIVWTWDNLIEWGAKVHEQDPESFLLGGFGGDDGTPVGILLKFHCLQQLCVGSWVNNDWTMGFTAETLQNSYEYFLELQEKGVMQPVEETISAQTPLENAKWMNGEVGMMHGMSSTISTFAVEGMEIGVAACPMNETATDPCHGASPSQLMVVSAKSKAPEVATAFLQYMYNDEEAIKTLRTVRGAQPTTAGTQILFDAGLTDENTTRAMEIVQANSTQFFSMVSVREEFDVPYADITNEVLFGMTSAEDGAKQMVAEYEEAIAAIVAAE